MSLISKNPLLDIFKTSGSSFSAGGDGFRGGGSGARRGDSDTYSNPIQGISDEIRRLNDSGALFGTKKLDLDSVFPPVQDNLVSAPSTAESAHDGADAYADYSNTSAYDDYLAMLQKGADIGLFSTAQDVVNEAQKDRLFQSLEAEKERSWYEDLANSSYQRQVKDLQVAGLNPILGFANLGTGSVTAHSAVPSGRATGLSAVAPNLADYLSAGSNLVSSASKVVSSVSSLLKSFKK